ncbi:hypothetical protein R3W88_001139 [Solanum pinnatisectum]|uniref:Uncharacterized protein n=1 Tax=Solanum pinnatisectum TaxID=50273 RepID=A0AAV9ML55_9SOLN|nr:hypothetical protein R3W88_001139 [Solanum pinnatisectum]
MSIGCGLFKFLNSKLKKYTVTNNFSHVVIFPKIGEVCSIYKNWSAQLMKDVKFLEWLKGFKSVYKARVEEEEANKVVKICVSEHLRLSHRNPAFCLTEERGGSLRGFWELDPVGMSLCLVTLTDERTVAHFVTSLFNITLINEFVCASRVYEYGQVPIFNGPLTKIVFTLIWIPGGALRHTTSFISCSISPSLIIYRVISSTYAFASSTTSLGSSSPIRQFSCFLLH